MARLKLTLTVSVGFELIVVALLVVVRFAQSAYAQPLYPTITTLPLPSSEYDV